MLIGLEEVSFANFTGTFVRKPSHFQVIRPFLASGVARNGTLHILSSQELVGLKVMISQRYCMECWINTIVESMFLGIP